MKRIEIPELATKIGTVNKWRDLETDKPQDGQRVLCYHPDLGRFSGGRADLSPEIWIGYYIADLDCVRPTGSQGFVDVRYWMPLPAPPALGKSAKKYLRKRKP
jgi:hypothetical protein